MAYLSTVTVKGHKYYRLVESYREDGKVKHRILKNYGRTAPLGVSATVVSATKDKVVDKSVSATVVRATKVPTRSVVRKEALKKALEVLNVTNLPLTRGRGGNRHPIAVKQFILDRLAQVGEDYISGMHQAYKAALDQLARDRRRTYYYHHPVYSSFSKKVWALIQEGLIEFSGREEPSDNPSFSSMKNKPMRRYYRLVRGR